jgi:hypothetical protein
MRFLTTLFRALFRLSKITPMNHREPDRGDEARLLTEAERRALRAAGQRGMRRKFLKRIRELD